MGDACCITPLSRALCLSPGHGRSPKFLIVFKNVFHFFRISLLLTPFCQQCGGFFFFSKVRGHRHPPVNHPLTNKPC